MEKSLDTPQLPLQLRVRNGAIVRFWQVGWSSVEQVSLVIGYPAVRGQLGSEIGQFAQLMMNMRIYVGNLSFKTTEHDLENAFSRFGHVTEVKIMQDRETGRSRGFAFVTMASSAEGQAAVEGLNGRELDGRNLTVNEARPREERSGGGAGFRSYSGGRSSYGGRRG